MWITHLKKALRKLRRGGNGGKPSGAAGSDDRNMERAIKIEIHVVVRKIEYTYEAEIKRAQNASESKMQVLMN